MRQKKNAEKRVLPKGSGESQEGQQGGPKARGRKEQRFLGGSEKNRLIADTR